MEQLPKFNFRRFIRLMRTDGLTTAINDVRSREGLIGGNDIEREVLITGCGSSGTTFLGELMNYNGIPITHDYFLGQYGLVSNACVNGDVWVYDYDRQGNKDFVMMKLPVEGFRKVIHVVRHPLKVIGSVQMKWDTWGHVWPHVTAGMDTFDHSQPNSLLNASRYWLEWNEKVEPLAHKRFIFEELAKDPKPLFDYCGQPMKRLMPRDKKSGQSYVKKYPEWDEIAAVDADLAERIKAKARDYGYEVPA